MHPSQIAQEAAADLPGSGAVGMGSTTALGALQNFVADRPGRVRPAWSRDSGSVAVFEVLPEGGPPDQ